MIHDEEKPLNEEHDIQARRQKTLNETLAYSKTMTKPSMNEPSDTCVYRAPDGNRCFIGHFIPDELYSLTMEENNAHIVVNGSYPAVTEHFDKQGLSLDGDFLECLQKVHDSHFDKREDFLRDLARKYKLEFPSLEN